MSTKYVKTRKRATSTTEVMSVPDLNKLINDTLNIKKRNFDELLSEYKVVKSLRSGTTAEIFLVQQNRTGELVVVKEQLLRRGNMQAMQREAMIHSQCEHPGVVRLMATAANQRAMVIVEEYMEGGELYDVIVPGVGLSTAQTGEFMVQLVKAIRYLHSVDIVHRDIKPENIVLNKDLKAAKITDFGLSIQLCNERETKYKRYVGTVPYMSPELLVDDSESFIKKNMKAVDVWSLGIVLFCMLTGRFAWEKASIDCPEYRRYCTGQYKNKPWRSVPEMQTILLMHMLDVNPETRWTIEEVQEYLREKWIVDEGVAQDSENSDESYSGDSGVESETTDDSAISVSLPNSSHIETAFPLFTIGPVRSTFFKEIPVHVANR
eukprot:CFRG4428T1